MGKVTMDRSQSTAVDPILRDELARGNRAKRSVAPVMQYFLDCDGPSLFSDAIIAGVRGHLDHLTRQFLGQVPQARVDDPLENDAFQPLFDRLAGDASVIDHLYSVTLEALIARNLEQRWAIDPVLSPLLQELIASENPAIAELAMKALAAQSRFILSQRRMELPVGELPSEVFARALEHAEETAAETGTSARAHQPADLKRSFDEGTNRLGLFARLASAMKGGAVAGVDLSHAGIALFASSCAALLSLDREQTVFACHEEQSVRLALMLKAIGLSNDAIERQIVLLGGTRPIPGGLETISQSHAKDVLASHLHEGAAK